MTISKPVTSSVGMNLTAKLVTAYVCYNNIPALELPALIAQVHASLDALAQNGAVRTARQTRATPEQIRASIKPDCLISFEDGKGYQVLRRHLSLLGMTAEEYRARWGLPPDYPMTSAAYSAKRSKIAHANKLGHKRSGVALAA